MAENLDDLENVDQPKSFGEVLKDAFKELKETAIAFFNAPKALWGINVPYILEGLVYFGILTILGKYSSENVGLEDIQSSLVYSFVTGGITFSMLIFGGYSDKIGVRKSLIVAFAGMLLGRVLISLSGSLGLANGIWSPMFFTMCIGLLIMVMSYGLYQPAAYAGVKRYTTPQTSAMAYAANLWLYEFRRFLFWFYFFLYSSEFRINISSQRINSCILGLCWNNSICSSVHYVCFNTQNR